MRKSCINSFNFKNMKKNILYLCIIILIIIIAMISGNNNTKEPENNSLQKQQTITMPKEQEEHVIKKGEEILKNDNIENTYNEMIDRLPDHFMVCIPTETVICTEGKCENTNSKVFNLLSGGKSDSNISRCDSKGCDTYPSIYETSGIFEIIQPEEPRGFFLKRQSFSLDENQLNNYLPYTEIVSLSLATQISSGYCIDVKYGQ